LESAIDEASFKRTRYRTTFFNTIVIGLAVVAAPGLCNARQSTGAGGQHTPYLITLIHMAVEGLEHFVVDEVADFLADGLGY
jgi:hypothetical protein